MFDSFPMQKALLGSLTAPLLLIILWSVPNTQLCTGFLLLVSVVFWYITCRKIADLFGHIRGPQPRRPHLITYTEATPPPSLPPMRQPSHHSGPDSIFL